QPYAAPAARPRGPPRSAAEPPLRGTSNSPCRQPTMPCRAATRIVLVTDSHSGATWAIRSGRSGSTGTPPIAIFQALRCADEAVRAYRRGTDSLVGHCLVCKLGLARLAGKTFKSVLPAEADVSATPVSR